MRSGINPCITSTVFLLSISLSQACIPTANCSTENSSYCNSLPKVEYKMFSVKMDNMEEGHTGSMIKCTWYKENRHTCVVSKAKLWNVAWRGTKKMWPAVIDVLRFWTKYTHLLEGEQKADLEQKHIFRDPPSPVHLFVSLLSGS